jgi:hypothetical protein
VEFLIVFRWAAPTRLDEQRSAQTDGTDVEEKLDEIFSVGLSRN